MTTLEQPLRLAVVGLGPTALRALDELRRVWPAERPLEVHCFDPHLPGEGSAFDVEQPPQLRLAMNPSHRHRSPVAGLDDWLRGEGLDPAGDVPRAMVGRYLGATFRRMASECPRGVQVLHHRTTVHRLTPVDDGWLVAADTPVAVDEVLLCTGYAPHHDDELARTWDADQPTRLVPSVYPVVQQLGLEQVPAGSTVAVRGAGLAFVDLVLTLTEGRTPADWPARILPIARSGRLYDASPPPGWQLHPQDRALLEQAAHEVPDQPREVVALLARTAVELLCRNGHGPRDAHAAVHHTLATGWEPDLVRLGNRAQLTLDRSIAVAELAERPGAAWMLARTWDHLRAGAHQALAFRTDIDVEAWQEFARVQRVLGRLCEGPTLADAIRLSNLCQHRVVDLSWLGRELTVTDRIHGLADDEQPDVLVDAVLSPPGAATARSPLLDQLLSDDLLHRASGRRGVLVDHTGNCLDSNHHKVLGLSALGPPVADVVPGPASIAGSAAEPSAAWARRLASR